MPDGLITAREAAEILGKSKETVLRMSKDGRLPVAHTVSGYNGHRLFDRTVVELVARNGKGNK